MEGGDLITAPYGLYLEGTSKYIVQDNLFDNAIPGLGTALSHGFIANNTGQNTNQVRRNHFVGIARALKFQGNNRSSNYSYGAKYLCNDFVNNETDIRELNSPWGYLNGLPHQGPADPLNTFTNVNCLDAIKDDISNTASNYGITSTHEYRRPTIGTEPMTCEVTMNSVVIIEPIGTVNCIGNLGIPPSQGGTSICSVDKLNAETAYTTIKTLHDAIVDGGNTEALVTAVLYADFSDALQTYYTLMGQSPNLSEEVMVQALKNYELPNVLVALILASNPQAANSDDVLEEIENRLVPFSEYQHQQVMQGLAVLSNLEVLEREMASLVADREMAMYCMMMEIDEDETIENKAAAAEALLQPSVYYNDMLAAINIRAAQGDIATSIQLAHEANYYFELGRQDQLDLEALQLVLQTEQDLIAQQGIAMYSGQRDVLEQAMYHNSSYVASCALLLLRAYDNYEYIEPIVDHDNSLRSFDIDKRNEKTEGLKAYPNPAESLVTLDYKSAEVLFVEVFDLTGKKVMTQSTNSAASQFFLDLSPLSPSLYEIRLLNVEGSTLDSIVIMKQ